MVSRLQSWVFIGLAMIIMGIALFPVIRVIVGVDDTFEIQFLTFIMFLVAGLMCGLTGMLLLARRQPERINYQTEEQDHKMAMQFHACGLLLFTGVPLLNFLVCYYLWVKCRHRSMYLDYQGREAICFQITIYLYLLLSLFMVIAFIGLFTTPLLLVFHLIVSVVAMVMVSSNKPFRYPANITIIARSPHSAIAQK